MACGLLLLETGEAIWGEGFGSPGAAVGELVFTTSMTGYVESLTDPSYRGQILLFSAPLIGNHGVQPASIVDEHGLPVHWESFRVQASGVVVHRATRPSHWASCCSLDEWLSQWGVPGVQGVDTRMIVRRIRSRGVVKAALYSCRDNEERREALEKAARALESAPSYDSISFEEVSTFSEVRVMGKGRRLVAVIDAGVKLNIVRSLLRLGFRVAVVPLRLFSDKLLDSLNPDSFLLGSGPGNPASKKKLVKAAVRIIERGKKTLGVCLGAQILALALGAQTYKLPFGHRSTNKPVLEVSTGRCYVTTHNHGYAIEERGLAAAGLKKWFVSVDDNVIEGVVHDKLPVRGVQFHPEGGPGPKDAVSVFGWLAA